MYKRRVEVTSCLVVKMALAIVHCNFLAPANYHFQTISTRLGSLYAFQFWYDVK